MYAAKVRLGRLDWSPGHPVNIRETVLALACLLPLDAGLRQYGEFNVSGKAISSETIPKMIHVYY